ncbi:twin-arginine translocation signal domain-containing protein [Halostagnicola bangensis]
MKLSRRTALKAGVGAISMAVLAGCASDDASEETDDGTETPDDGDDDGSESDPDSEPEEHSLELLVEENVAHEHACLHSDFDDRMPLEASDSSEDAPTEEETHVIWEISYEGDQGYFAFDADAHEYDGPFVFYTAEGSAEPVEGTEQERDAVDDDECETLDEYVEVETPEDGRIVLELQTS